MPIKYLKWVIVALTASFIMSCAPTKKAAYFRKYDPVADLEIPDKVYNIQMDSADIIQEGDELYISVTSGADEPTGFGEGVGSAALGLELISYEVDHEGYVRLPHLKRFKAAGLSVEALEDTLESALSQYVRLPSVRAQIINKQVIVLGEVHAPGVYVFNRRNVSIYEVLGHAGDIAPFGNRENVLIVRTEDDQVMKKKVDLTNDDILGSQWYHIQPDDIVYVEPLGRRRFGMETFSIFDIFGLVTGTVSVYLLVTGLTD